MWVHVKKPVQDTNPISCSGLKILWNIEITFVRYLRNFFMQHPYVFIPLRKFHLLASQTHYLLMRVSESFLLKLALF